MPSPSDYIIALLRAAGQGTAADVAGGLSGLAQLPQGGLQGATQAIEQAQNDLGYQPQGAQAEALSNVGEFMRPVTEPIGQAVDWVGERSPIAGAMLHAAPVVAGAGPALRAGRGANRAANTILAEELRRPRGMPSSQEGVLKFLKETGMPTVDDPRLQPKYYQAYYRLYKGRDVLDTEMTPDEFLRQANYGDMEDTTWINPDKLKRLRERDREGTPVHRPALFYYEMDPEFPFPASHEGRHRALVAKEGGAQTIPVSVLRDYLDPDFELWDKVKSGELTPEQALELVNKSK